MRNKRISPAEPVSELRHVRIRECGEEMVNFLELCPDLLLDVPRFNYQRATLLRRTVAEKLCQANRNLKGKFRLAIVEGWRSPRIQRRMYLGIWNRYRERYPDWSDVKLKRVVNRYTAPLDPRVPPPHTTGGAIDLLLADENGKILDHCTPFDPYDHHCYSFDAPGLSAKAREVRDRLAEAILPTGITNYPSEYWHWTCGDQGWAYRGGLEHAIYGMVEPVGWQIRPEDDVDEPLKLIEVPHNRDAGA